MRGIKNEEYRSIPTNVRGKIYIYALYTLSAIVGSVGLRVQNEDLPQRVIIRSVEITRCESNKRTGYARLFANQERLREYVKSIRNHNLFGLSVLTQFLSI
jgi:3-methyladenine DNA glycosylase Mpg